MQTGRVRRVHHVIRPYQSNIDEGVVVLLADLRQREALR